MTDIYNNTEAFALMSAEKQAAMKAHGGTLTVFTGAKWPVVNLPYWEPSMVYRAVRPAEKPMTVDPLVWRVLTLNFITRDKNGALWAWGERPVHDSCEWVTTDGGVFRCDGRIAPGLIDPGTCDWREAIVERPKGGGA